MSGANSTSRLVAFVLIAFVGIPNGTVAQERPNEITFAFYAPSIYFRDSVARAGFISSLASDVETATGIRVRGFNISNARDLSDVDVAIVDGLYFSGSQEGQPLLTTEAEFGSAAPLALIISSGGPSALHELQGSTLILPRVGSRLEDFITAEILRSEISADEFFGDIQYTSNIESALSAVAQGRADATVAFEPYGSRSGLGILRRYAEAPTPVLVQLDESLPETVVGEIERAVRSASGSGGIQGFVGYEHEAISGFRRHATPVRPERQPLMARSRSRSIALRDIDLVAGEEDLSIAPPVDLIDVPQMEEP